MGGRWHCGSRLSPQQAQSSTIRRGFRRQRTKGAKPPPPLRGPPPPLRTIAFTHLLLRILARFDSVLVGLTDGAVDGGLGVRTGTIWRSSPGKRGVKLHA